MSENSNKITRYKDLLDEIKSLNNEVWKLRYTDSKKALDLATTSFKLSIQNGNPLLIMQTRLYKTVCKYLACIEIDSIESELNALNNYFNDSTDIKSRAITLDFLARIYDSYGGYEKAIEYAKSAIKITKINNIPDIENEALTTLANIYRRLKKYDEALGLYKSALNIRLCLDDKLAAASSLNLIARTYTKIDDLKNSYEYYQKSLTLRTEINDSGISFTYLGIASNYEIQNKYDLAEKMYIKSIETNAKLSKSKLCDYLCCYGLGSIYYKMAEFDKSIDYMYKALELAIATNVKPNISKTHFALSQLYEKLDNHVKAYEHYKAYHKISDEISSDEIYQLKNIELNKKYLELEQKSTEIMDSIEYAKRLQTAIFPSGDLIKTMLPERFILYKPKNIVSGDFYWINKYRKKIIIVAADCTGHGVPGALMSMLGVAFLNEIVSKMQKLQANLILNKLREKVKKALQQKGNAKEQQDGMDIALCIYDSSNNTIQFSGAKNSIYIIRNNQLKEYKGDKMPIGIYLIENDFTNHVIDVQKGDMIYMTSDGYTDQFGGESGKKFLSKKFKELLLEISNLNLKKQNHILNETIENWKSHINTLGEPYEQTDDIMVIGIRI